MAIQLGKRHLLINAATKRDHLHLGVGFLRASCRPSEDANKKGTKWDKDTLMRAIITGHYRREFLAEVERAFTGLAAADLLEHYQFIAVRDGWRRPQERV